MNGDEVIENADIVVRNKRYSDYFDTRTTSRRGCQGRAVEAPRHVQGRLVRPLLPWKRPEEDDRFHSILDSWRFGLKRGASI